MYKVGDRVFWFGESGELIRREDGYLFQHVGDQAWIFQRDSDLHHLTVFERELQKIRE